MVSYKLDKYDKYFVAFVLFIVTIVSLCNCVKASEEALEPIVDYKENVCLSSSGWLVSYNGFATYFLTLEEGYYYDITITNNSNNTETPIRVGFTNSQDAGTEVYNFAMVENNYHIILNSSDYQYFYFDFGGASIGDDISYTISKYESQSMAGSVKSLVDNVGPQQLWSVFESGIDFIGVVVLVAFGLFLIVLLIKKLSKGKSDY